MEADCTHRHYLHILLLLMLLSPMSRERDQCLLDMLNRAYKVHTKCIYCAYVAIIQRILCAYKFHIVHIQCMYVWYIYYGNILHMKCICSEYILYKQYIYCQYIVPLQCTHVITLYFVVHLQSINILRLHYKCQEFATLFGAFRYK